MKDSSNCKQKRICIQNGVIRGRLILQKESNGRGASCLFHVTFVGRNQCSSSWGCLKNLPHLRLNESRYPPVKTFFILFHKDTGFGNKCIFDVYLTVLFFRSIFYGLQYKTELRKYRVLIFL